MKREHNKFIPDDQFLRDNGVLFPKIGIKIDEDGIYTFTWENYNTKEDFDKLASYLGWSCEEFSKSLGGFINRASITIGGVDKIKFKKIQLNKRKNKRYKKMGTRGLTKVSKKLGTYGKSRNRHQYQKGSAQYDFVVYIQHRVNRQNQNKKSIKINIDKIIPRVTKDHRSLDSFDMIKKEIIKLRIKNHRDLKYNHRGIEYAIKVNKFLVSQFEDYFVCPGKSSNESNVKEFLENNNISYQSQKAIFYKNRKLVPDFIIEFSGHKIMLEPGGSQHLSEKSYDRITKGTGNFKDSISRDKLKFQWAIENKVLPIYWFNPTDHRKECLEVLKNGYMDGQAIYFLEKEDYFNFILELKNLLEDNPEEYSDFGKLTDLAMKLYQTKQNKGA